MNPISPDLADENQGVSAIVGVLLLVVIVLLLSAGVFVTASTLIGEQPNDITAGTTTERVSIYEYETDLVTSGNAKQVHVVSPLGTHYNLSQAGDSAKVLAVEFNSSRDGIGRLRVQGYSSQDADAETQLLESKKVEEGVEPGYIVAKDGTFEETFYKTSINHSFTTAGERDLTVKAIDIGTNSETTYSESVTIYESPKFDLSPETTDGFATREYTYAAENVSGTEITYQWEFDDGTTATGQTVNHTYDDPGLYDVNLTVTDGNGITKTKTVQISMESMDPYYGCKKFESDTTLTAGTYDYTDKNCVVIKTGVTVTAQGNPSADGPNNHGGVKILATGPIYVNGTINANEQGYGSQSGPGSPEGSSGYGVKSSGSYGGKGTQGDYTYVGDTYGSATSATRLGSGGGKDSYSDYVGGSGGGAIWLKSSSEIEVNGKLTANGESKTGTSGAGSGSGGAVRLEASDLLGTGTISARGGDGIRSSGGGGRIYVEANNPSSVNLDASAGSVTYSFEDSGQDGTVRVSNP